jgi:hypothetical protein
MSKKFWGYFVIILAGLVVGFLLLVPTNKPSIEDNTNVQGLDTYATPDGRITYLYPKDLGLKYMSTIDWPPMVQVVDGLFTCTQAGSETARAGVTERITVDSKEYCVTKVVEGAAGSTYTQYAYVFLKDDKIYILTFTMRASQCANYDSPERDACEYERDTFSIDTVIDSIARTLQSRS